MGDRALSTALASPAHVFLAPRAACSVPVAIGENEATPIRKTLNFPAGFLISFQSGSGFAMLIRLPGGSSDQPGSRNSEECSPFEEGLRRDLASAPVVSYDAMLGGVTKRAIDLALSLLTLPLWLLVILVAMAWARLRHGGAVFATRECIGYGGRAFRCVSLRVERPSAKIERMRAPSGEAAVPSHDWNEIAGQAEGPRAKWRRALERLPQLFNVIAGDMALVGPAPLSREELEPLRTARRYYLSARPGVVGVSTIVAPDQEASSQYKIYTMAWSVSMDALILWDALRSLRDRGELWKPGFKLAKGGRASVQADVVVRRRRGA